MPNKNFKLVKLRILRVFFKFHGGFTFFENVQKKGTRAPFFSAITEEPKKGFFSFLAIFDKNTSW